MFAMTFSSVSLAANIKFAAFTGVYICANHEGTGGQELCMLQLNHEPNVEFDQSQLPAVVALDHSQYGISINTKVTVGHNANNTIYKTSLKVESFEPLSGKYFVNPISINIQNIDSLGIIKVTGEKLCRNDLCNEWFLPFIYLGPAFSQEKARTFNLNSESLSSAY